MGELGSYPTSTELTDTHHCSPNARLPIHPLPTLEAHEIEACLSFSTFFGTTDITRRHQFRFYYLEKTWLPHRIWLMSSQRTRQLGGKQARQCSSLVTVANGARPQATARPDPPEPRPVHRSQRRGRGIAGEFRKDEDLVRSRPFSAADARSARSPAAANELSTG